MSQNRYLAAPRLPEEEGFDPRLWLGSGQRPIELEIGPGRGWFMVERLSRFSEVWMVGLEVRRKWATIVDERLKAKGFGARARVVAEDAKLALPKWIDGCVGVAFIHFPDPWWKRRHEKRRVVGDGLIATLGRLIVPGGELFIQSDVEGLMEEAAESVSSCPDFASLEDSVWVGDQPYGARSPRERRVMSDGLPVFRLRYRRNGGESTVIPVETRES